MKRLGIKRAWPGVLVGSAIASELLAADCGQAPRVSASDSAESVTAAVAPASTPMNAVGDSNPLRNAYFGDLHVHTKYSNDASGVGLHATPEDAYRYPEGEVVQLDAGYSIRLRGGALEFYGVSDHSEYLGVVEALADPDGPLGSHPMAKRIQSGDQQQIFRVLSALTNAYVENEKPDLDASAVIRSSWQEIIEAAERHNRPGRFTTFIAYEYSSAPNRTNLHRNVIFAGSQTPEAPFSAVESANPEDLWTWMDVQRDKGIDSLAIPHNSNLSRGLMFQRTNWADESIDAAYGAQRARNEPLVEDRKSVV